MAGFNKQLAAQLGQGALGFAGATMGALTNVPRRSQVDRTHLALMNMGFSPSDPEGLMAQYNQHQVGARPISAKSLYNPSMGDSFRSMFNAGMGMYGATSGLTDPLKGNMGSTSIGNQRAAYDKMVTKQANQRVAEGDLGLREDVTKEAMMQEAGYGSDSELAADMFESMYGCGGHLHGCGGHKLAGGGMVFDNGAMLGQAINLLGAGLGVGLNAVGMASERKKAEQDAAKYNFDLQFLRDREAHDLESTVFDSSNNMFNMQAVQMKAHGGDLHTHGADFQMLGEYNFIGTGGTHEQNPYGGVPQGLAADGEENLVEKDEVVWNDYVFSHRLTVPDAIRSKYKLRKPMSYAEAAEKLIAEAKERPNDPISQNGMEAKLSDLQNSQEDVRMQRQATQIRKQLAAMSPEELMQIQAAMQQVSPTQQATYAAEGGHLFPWGGITTMFSPNYEASLNAGYIPYDRAMTNEQVLAAENEQLFKDWTKYVNDNWDTEEVQNYLKALDAAAGGNHLFGKDGKILATAKDYFNNARTKDHKWGYYHLTPTFTREVAEKAAAEKAAAEKEEDKKDKENLDTETTVNTESGRRGTPLLPTWMRYAPALAPLFADYTARDYSTAIPPRLATYRPLGDYLPYNPIDTQRYLTAINQQDAARRGAIQNMSGANRNIAMAQDALAEYQRQQDIANVLNTAEAINFDRRAKVGDFNRGTNQFNAQAYNQTDFANMRVPEFMLHQAANNARMRKAVDDAIDAAKGETISSALDTWHNIGKENFAFNQANNNPALYYGTGLNGAIDYLNYIADKRASKEAEDAEDTDKKAEAAFGGMLTKKRKGRR